MAHQLSLQLDESLVEKFSSLRACVALGVYERNAERIASMIDMAPSNLSAALGGENRHLSIEAFEKYIEKTGDVRPIHYLVARFIGMDEGQVAAAREARIESLLSEAIEMIAERKAVKRRAK